MFFRPCLSRLFRNIPRRHSSYTDYSLSRGLTSLPRPEDRRKQLYRKGRNLRDRYLALEKLSRGKELARAQGEQRQSTTAQSPVPGRSTHIPTFKSFVVPIEPSPPEPDECCMSGCAVCVYDLYEESLETYKKDVETLRASLVALNIPESEWPEHIQTKGSSLSPPSKRINVVMSAFEELEQRLKEKAVAQPAGSTITNASAPKPGIAPLSYTYQRPPESRAPFSWKEVWEVVRWMMLSNR